MPLEMGILLSPVSQLSPTAPIPQQQAPWILCQVSAQGQSFPGPGAAQQWGTGSEKGRIQFISHCALSCALPLSQGAPWPGTEISLISQ